MERGAGVWKGLEEEVAARETLPSLPLSASVLRPAKWLTPARPVVVEDGVGLVEEMEVPGLGGGSIFDDVEEEFVLALESDEDISAR